MQVKVFQGFGKQGIDALETEINVWLEQLSRVKVVHTDISAAGGIGSADEGERYQTLIACVWYEPMT